jgi:hypothetical protein
LETQVQASLETQVQALQVLTSPPDATIRATEAVTHLEQFVNRYSNVEHVTGRGGGFERGQGSVLMAWAEMDDIGKLVRYGGHGIRALCVITWNEDGIRPWMSAVRPTVLRVFFAMSRDGACPRSSRK